MEFLSEEFGWRQSYRMLPLIGIIGLLLAWVLLHFRADSGNLVIDRRFSKSRRSNPAENGVRVVDAVSNLEFWGLA